MTIHSKDEKREEGKAAGKGSTAEAESAAQPLAAALPLCPASSPHVGARWPKLHLLEEAAG